MAGMMQLNVINIYKKKNNMENFKELTEYEIMSISGGSPGKDTSFAYDLFYYASYGFRKLFEPTEESMMCHQLA